MALSVRALVLAAGAMILMAGRADAFLDTGTLLTNSASATYSAGSQGSSISYSATAKILVANPAVFLWKDGTPTQVTASAGGLVDFTICFSNGGANTAFNVTIKDKLPTNTYYWNNYSVWYTDLSGTVRTGTSTTAPDVAIYYATIGSDGPWFNPPTMGQSNAKYLQWVIPNQGVGKSGCIRFTVSIG